MSTSSNSCNVSFFLYMQNARIMLSYDFWLQVFLFKPWEYKFFEKFRFHVIIHTLVFLRGFDRLRLETKSKRMTVRVFLQLHFIN